MLKMRWRPRSSCGAWSSITFHRKYILVADSRCLPVNANSESEDRAETENGAMTPGIHLLYKPVGPTSFSLVQACLQRNASRAGRRPLRICHGGTLDPFASGLLLILVEPATRLFDYLHAIPKVYEATVRWGVETH